MMVLIIAGLFQGYSTITSQPFSKELSVENIVRDALVLMCFTARILLGFATKRSLKWNNHQIKILHLITIVYLVATFSQVHHLFNWVFYAGIHHYAIWILIMWSPLFFWTFEVTNMKRHERRRKTATLL